MAVADCMPVRKAMFDRSSLFVVPSRLAHTQALADDDDDGEALDLMDHHAEDML